MVEVDKVASHLHDVYQEGAEEVIANARYSFIDGLMAEAVKKPAVEKDSLKKDSIRTLGPVEIFDRPGDNNSRIPPPNVRRSSDMPPKRIVRLK